MSESEIVIEAVAASSDSEWLNTDLPMSDSQTLVLDFEPFFCCSLYRPQVKPTSRGRVLEPKGPIWHLKSLPRLPRIHFLCQSLSKQLV